MNDSSDQTGKMVAPLVDLHVLVHLQFGGEHTDSRQVEFWEHFARTLTGAFCFGLQKRLKQDFVLVFGLDQQKVANMLPIDSDEH